MLYINKILIFIFLLNLSGNLYSQKYHTTSSKALKAYNNGVMSYDYLDYSSAEQYLKQAVAADEKFYEAYMMLGELYTKQKKFSDAANNYRRAVKIDSLFYGPAFFFLANAEMMSGDYSSAAVHYRVYLEQKNISDKNKKKAIQNLKSCEFALEALKKPVPFNPVSVGTAINTPDDEYWPSLTADGLTLMFTRQINSGSRNGDPRSIQEDFYVSHVSGKEWQKAVAAGSPLNTPFNEGAQTLSSDGLYMYFTACSRPGGIGSCDIYFSAFSDGKWTMPVNIGSPVNTSSWESQPSVTADGKMLFFSSNRPGGFGGKDLWYTIRLDKSRWSDPVNCGSSINTDGDEMSPFIHFDGRTLYFASDGRTGMGGFDIY
ncbi:MAG: PD40 domain-containing protein, partial [Bacteroidales bacterium]|nr:PD40 domain-containing protein [Bacteroidales bacterium]